MSRVLAGLRRLAEPPGPREGRTPTRATRAFTARRNRVLDGGSGVAVVVDLPAGEDTRALVVTADGRAELVSAILGSVEAAGLEAPALAFVAAAVAAASAAPEASSLALPASGGASCLVVLSGGVRHPEPIPAAVLAAAEALASQLERRLPGLIR